MRPNRVTAPAASLALALALAIACAKRDDGRSGEAPAAADARIAEVQVGKSVNSAHQVENPSDRFAPGDTIWASVKTEDTPAGTTILVHWVYTEQGEQVVSEDTHTTSAAGTGFTHFYAANANPWPAGSYELRVGLNGEIKETKTFSVEG